MIRIGEWCTTVAHRLGEMDWAEKRVVLDALGVQVQLFSYQHDPRFIITADIPVETVLHTTNGTRRRRFSRCRAWRGSKAFWRRRETAG
jgi:hypothetical protein